MRWRLNPNHVEFSKLVSALEPKWIEEVRREL